MNSTPPSSKRRLLLQAMAGAGIVTFNPRPALPAAAIVIANVTGLYSVEVARAIVAESRVQIVRELLAWPGKVGIGGGRYSMGGQIASAAGLHIDMRGMNKLVRLDAAARVVRVEAGMRWRDLQEILDPLGLAVQTMQSYANFTVGGSVSVNAHGRYVGHGPIANSVRALQLVLADGAIVEASRSVHAELFRAAIGGYGAVGIITEVELDLAQNGRIERLVETVALDAYPAYFRQAVEGRTGCLLHNADLLPPAFDAPVAISWFATDAPVTEPARLVARGQSYRLNQQLIFAITELPGGAALSRDVVHPLLLAGRAVRWRNYEASCDVAELEPLTRAMSTFALQEYFVPVRHFAAFVRAMAAVIRAHAAPVLNVSVRHSGADRIALLPWATEEVFSFVVYYKQRRFAASQRRVGAWTRAMIDVALGFDARYYLPYQLHATRAQFDRAYPEAAQLRMLKRRVDPNGKFSNAMWAKYL